MRFNRWFNGRARPGDSLENIKFRDGEAIIPKCLSKGRSCIYYFLNFKNNKTF